MNVYTPTPLPRPGPQGSVTAEFPSKKLRKAADLLTSELKRTKIEANQRPAGGMELPPNTLLLRVGFKPQPYFDPEEVKKLREEMERMRREMDENFKWMQENPPGRPEE